MLTRRSRWIIRGLVYLALPLGIAAWIVNAYPFVVTDPWQDFLLHSAESAIQRYGAQLPPVDEVRLLRLDQRNPGQHLGEYDASYSWDYPSSEEISDVRFIVRQEVIVGAEAQRLAELWRGLTLRPGSAAMCHEPHHVVQFYRNGSKVLDVPVCFLCVNASLPFWTSRTLVSPAEDEAGYQRYKAFKAIIEARVGKAEETRSKQAPRVRPAPSVLSVPSADPQK